MCPKAHRKHAGAMISRLQGTRTCHRRLAFGLMPTWPSEPDHRRAALAAGSNDSAASRHTSSVYPSSATELVSRLLVTDCTPRVWNLSALAVQIYVSSGIPQSPGSLSAARFLMCAARLMCVTTRLLAVLPQNTSRSRALRHLHETLGTGFLHRKHEVRAVSAPLFYGERSLCRRSEDRWVFRPAAA